MVAAHVLEGSIAGAGFASGDRVVVGTWRTSPIGAFSDVMWAEVDDWRTLFVPHAEARSFVTAVYAFDQVIVDPTLDVRHTTRSFDVCWSKAELGFRLGVAVPFPPRPSWVTQRIELPIARRIMNVQTYGVSPSGIEETYQARRLHRIVDGWAVVEGRDLGAIGPPTPACRFGFSEPPSFPSVTDVTSLLVDPSGGLDGMLSELTET